MSADPRLPHDWFPRPLPPNVELGAGAWLYSAYAFLHCRSARSPAVRIGAGTGIYHGTFFELGPGGSVEIGDTVAVVGATFRTDRRIVVGDYTFIAHEVVIADEAAPVPPDAGDGHAPPPDPEEISVRIGENVWIGARAILLGGADVGEGAVVGAAAVVDGVVPPFAIAAGNPARVVGSVRP